MGAIERGEINPTFRILFQLAGALGVLPSDLAAMYERNRTEQRTRAAGRGRTNVR